MEEKRTGMNKSISVIPAGILIFTLLLTGCGSKKQVVSGVNSNIKDTGITVSNNVPVKEERIIAGAGMFETEGSKMVMIEDAKDDRYFDVYDSNTGNTVFSGKIKANKKGDSGLSICDFSEIDREGTYILRTESGEESEPIEIKTGLYKELLAERLSYFGGTSYDNDINEENIQESYMRISDRLLAQEFFSSSINQDTADDPRIIPRTILLAKAETDLLKELYEKRGSDDTFLHSDMELLFQYSAVFAMMAYDYEEYDKACAKEYEEIAKNVYETAEKKHLSGLYTVNKTTDGKRFWASAQLYKLTGLKQYKETAESYADIKSGSIPGGFSEDENGYLGIVAYLTCYNKIDLEIAKRFITALMNDINDMVRRSSEEKFFAESVQDNDEDTVKKVFENARLAVLGNYISKSIKYVECGENQIAYLYGRNMLGKDYALRIDSEFYDEPQEFILAGLIDTYIYEDKKPEAMGR